MLSVDNNKQDNDQISQQWDMIGRRLLYQRDHIEIIESIRDMAQFQVILRHIPAINLQTCIHINRNVKIHTFIHTYKHLIIHIYIYTYILK